MKRILCFVFVFLVACGQSDVPSTPMATTVPAGQEEVAPQATIAATSEVQPTAAEATAVGTHGPEGGEIGTTSEPVAEQTVAATATLVVTEAAEPTEEVTINGRNDDNTFFRGASNAAVTMIDYSDFL